MSDHYGNVGISANGQGSDTIWEVIENGDDTVLLRNVGSGAYLDLRNRNVVTTNDQSKANEVHFQDIEGSAAVAIQFESNSRYADADQSYYRANVDTHPNANRSDRHWLLIPVESP